MRAISAVLIILGVHGVSFAQTGSPYSALGIGDMYTKSMVQHYSMGGLGISNSSRYYQNTLNPALLADNGVYSFSTAFTGESKTTWQEENREVASGANLSYINMVFPIKQGQIATSVGVLPFSRVNYDFASEAPVVGNSEASVATINSGEGGFNQFAFSLGAKITKGLYIGGTTSYVFGSITKQQSVLLTEPLAPYVPTSRTQLTAGDFTFGVGAVYKQIISEQYRINIGGVYNFDSDLSVTNSQTLITNTTTSTPIQIDTLQDNVKGTIYLPASYGAGISFEKFNKWMVGVDLRYQGWDDYLNFDGGNPNLVSAMQLIVGGEFTPNSASVDNYFSRITYRFGFNIGNTPYHYQDTQINEYGMNFGFSLPVANFSSLDMGFRYGSRGTIDNMLIKEDFFRIYFGVTFNDSRWFQRPKYN